MISTSIGTTVLIMDNRDGELIWMSGTVTEMKSVSPFVADRDIMLYNRAGSDEASKILAGLNGPHNEHRLITEFVYNLNLLRIGKVITQAPVQQPATNRSKMMLPKWKAMIQICLL